MWSYDSSKSPSPDGFSLGFIKESWLLISGEEHKMFEEFHCYRKILKDENSSFIMHIPKKESKQSLNDFRPISLEGSLYKIFSKVLAN